jgi:hypothetical protein
MPEIKREAERPKVELVSVPTVSAIQELRRNTKSTNAILHVTCRIASTATRALNFAQ